MFGMSSKEFWEDDPQLYWAYRTFYLKKLENEQKEKIDTLKYNSWLNGNMNFTAHCLSLNNAFSKQKKDFPQYKELFKSQEDKKLSNEEVNKKIQDEFNAWARY